MNIIFGFLIFIAIISTAILFAIAMHGHWTNKEDNTSSWKPVFILLAVSGILMINQTLVVESATLNEAFFILWIVVSVGMFISLACSRFYNLKYKEKGKFKKISRNAFIIGFILFIFYAVTIPGTSVEEGAAAAEPETVDKAQIVSEAQSAEEAEQEAQEKQEKEEAEEARLKAEKEQAAAEAEKIEKEREAQAAQKQEELEKQKAEKAKKLAEEKAQEEANAAAGLTAVSLYRVVDGDTVHVIDGDNNLLKLRLLLIDTPETVHPNKPVEPFGPEASARMTELLNNAESLHIEYDTGAQTDHYDRHLVYLYADGESVHEVMLREGLARVGYIYEQQRYLSEFREAEQYAKDNQLGIWSIPGYVNTAGEGFNSEEEPQTEAKSTPAVQNITPDSSGNHSFNNCTELKEVYPGGVSSEHEAYQPKMDRDKDNWACES